MIRELFPIARVDWLEDLEFLVLILMGIGGSVASWLKKRREEARAADAGGKAAARRPDRQPARPGDSVVVARGPTREEDLELIEELEPESGPPAPPLAPAAPAAWQDGVAGAPEPVAALRKGLEHGLGPGLEHRLGPGVQHSLGEAGAGLGAVGEGFGELGLLGGGEYGRLEGGAHGTSLRATAAARVEGGRDRRRVLSGAGGPISWRRAVVLAELLGPPRALGGSLPAGLRDEGAWPAV